ncbi:methyltransferase [Cellulomonas sp. NPDC058312]|uniref:methyltransferase n=1 Tax=Cellulomonas sp. NPDC058312 TaxID=3346441 RepID=UPI0036E72B29
MTSTTPLRALPAEVVDGVRVLRAATTPWLDGSEAELYDRMGSGLPLDSLSDELYATATSWPERYHLSPSRANVVRALDLPADATVLEIGAGCGAITRYLGETCATVDALEPTFERARVAARRTAELPGVTVHNAEVADLPAEPAYDLVVVVGVLEYVGGGGRDERPYVEFLEALRRTLRPGGRLVLAIENELGVKYLAGAPEDHSNQVFHSVQGYPVDGPARTFSRRRLAELARTAGFTGTEVLGAFPDYKLTRAVLAERLYDRAPELAEDLPDFPSPDWTTPRPELLDEAALWGELVAAGTGPDFANSFLLVAGTGGDPAPLWPEDRLARYFSLHRRRALQVRKTVHEDGDDVVITSERLGSGAQDGVEVLAYSERWRTGEPLARLALRDPASLDALVGSWAGLLRERAAASAPAQPFDVVPGNVLRRDDAAWVIDDEWRSSGSSLDEVVLRGALLLARDLLAEAPASTWGCEDGRALVRRVAAAAGRADVTDADVESAVEREAVLQATIGGGSPGTPVHERTRVLLADELRTRLDAPVAGAVPERVWEAEARLQHEAIEARDLLLWTGTQLDEARAEQDALRAELERTTAALTRAHDDIRQMRANPGVRVATAVGNRLRRGRTD